MKHDFKVIIFEQNIHRAVFSMPMWWLNLRIEQQILHVFNKTNVTNLQEKNKRIISIQFLFPSIRQVFPLLLLRCLQPSANVSFTADVDAQFFLPQCPCLPRC